MHTLNIDFEKVAREIRKLAKRHSSGVINIGEDGEVWHRDFLAATAAYAIDLEFTACKHWTGFALKEYIEECDYERECQRQRDREQREWEGEE